MQKLTWPLAATLACCASALALAACGGEDEGGGDARKGGSITLAQTAQPDSLDPGVAYTSNSWEPLWLVYTGPLTYKRAEGREGAELIPGLAEDLPEVSGGGLTYRFRFRRGLRYSDGRPLKASDFEHTVKRVLKLDSGTGFFTGIAGAERYLESKDPQADIEGIETNDRTREVVIELVEPDATFTNVLAMTFSGVVPVDTPFQDQTRKPPPGIGPYRLVRSVPNREFVMLRNRSFRLPGIPGGNIDRITTKIVGSDSRQAQDVIAGRLDYMQDPPPTDLLPEIRSRYRERYEEHATTSTYYFFMNLRTPPFGEEKVRRAVNLAIDGRALMRLFGGRLEISCNYLPKDVPGYEMLDPCPYGDRSEPPDLERARQLIEEAGEEGTKVRVWGSTDSNRRAIAEYLADALTKIGLDAEPEIVDGAIYLDTVGSARTRAQIGFANYFPDFPHPASLFVPVDGDSIQPTGSQNLGNVDDPVINEGIDGLKSELDADEVEKEAKKLDHRLVEKAYVAPYGSEKLSTFLSERLDLENCSRFHPLYQNDYSSFCLR
jgi:peptide/nickel transport system substrate-binding protein